MTRSHGWGSINAETSVEGMSPVASQHLISQQEIRLWHPFMRKEMPSPRRRNNILSLVPKSRKLLSLRKYPRRRPRQSNVLHGPNPPLPANMPETLILWPRMSIPVPPRRLSSLRPPHRCPLSLRRNNSQSRMSRNRRKGNPL
jgi:hypothetical protein